ncbi:MAG: hypothetical protein DI537_30940 [Stutzerimonas stutzeri]|nr:MAG: hypothetical protein DI537_30940 [Stutzerimonas stutzeri]
MTENLKALWDGLGAELKASPNSIHDPEVLKRLDAVMAPVNELMKQFQRERDHQPFSSQAPCPICSGTVRYQYHAPLVGSMKCDTPGCVSLNL